MSDLGGNPEDRFSQNEAHFLLHVSLAKMFYALVCIVYTVVIAIRIDYRSWRRERSSTRVVIIAKSLYSLFAPGEAV